MDSLRSARPAPLPNIFFHQDALSLAMALLGKILWVRHAGQELMVRIIETEAYELKDKASHSSLGYTTKRRALFNQPGTIYMYYSRAGDSLNFSALGPGNAVLIKAGIPVIRDESSKAALEIMQTNNPLPSGKRRPDHRLFSGQTLLCKALGLKVKTWDNKALDKERFQVLDDAYRPVQIIQTTRLGIRPDRDAHLPYRFIDYRFKDACSKDPTRVRRWKSGTQYTILTA